MSSYDYWNIWNKRLHHRSRVVRSLRDLGQNPCRSLVKEKSGRHRFLAGWRTTSGNLWIQPSGLLQRASKCHVDHPVGQPRDTRERLPRDYVFQRVERNLVKTPKWKCLSSCQRKIHEVCLALFEDWTFQLTRPRKTNTQAAEINQEFAENNRCHHLILTKRARWLYCFWINSVNIETPREPINNSLS